MRFTRIHQEPSGTNGRARAAGTGAGAGLSEVPKPSHGSNVVSQPHAASPRLARSHARTHERNEADFPVGLTPPTSDICVSIYRVRARERERKGALTYALHAICVRMLFSVTLCSNSANLEFECSVATPGIQDSWTSSDST